MIEMLKLVRGWIFAAEREARGGAGPRRWDVRRPKTNKAKDSLGFSFGERDGIPARQGATSSP
jgi:hypothetical protein